MSESNEIPIKDAEIIKRSFVLYEFILNLVKYVDC